LKNHERLAEPLPLLDALLFEDGLSFVCLFAT